MKRMPALAAAAVVALATLSGCGSDKATSTATSAATSAASSAMSAASSASDTSSSASSATTAASDASSASSATTAASDASSAASPTASSAPAGYHMATAPGQKLTFAIPNDWVAPSGKLLQQPAIANSLKDLDMMAISENPKNGFAANVNVNKKSSNDPRLATKDEVSTQLAKAQGTVTGFDKIQTALGEGQEITYSMVTDGKTHQAVALEVPTADGTYAAITVSSSSAQEAQDVAKVIVSTLKSA